MLINTGFDLLGTTRFILIKYYNRANSISRANITLLINKVGDCLLMSARLSMMLLQEEISSLLLVLAVSVKRALLP